MLPATTEAGGRAAGALLPELIRALHDPACYRHPVDEVHLVQTHVSYVLLAGDYAYKIKKPVDLGFLDYHTLRKRRHFCRREVALNQRLTEHVYLDVVRITRDEKGYHVGGVGRPVEYAVLMRRLPEERMLDHLLAQGRATGEMMEDLADVLALFHARSASGPALAPFGSPRLIRRNWEENLRQLEPFVGATLSVFQLQYLREFVRAFMRRERATFRRRVLQRRIRDCHGDLRTSSACFAERIQIYDCIEFNRRFRYGDVASEIAFLAMDLELRGRPELARRFVDRYVEASGDSGVRQLLDFYACYRAAVRGKVEGFRTVEPDVPPEERRAAQELARQALALASRCARRAGVPTLLITHGLSGTGKSTLAEGIARLLPLRVLSSDGLRKELAGMQPREHRLWPLHGGIYSRAFTRRTYRELMRRAAAQLAAGQSVLVDATFLKHWQRRAALRTAIRAGALFFCLDCRADDRLVRPRLARRDLEPAGVSDARLPVYVSQKKTAEPPTELSDWQRIEVDTGASIEEAVRRAQAGLEARCGAAQ